MPVQAALDASALGSGRGGDETYVRVLLDGLAATGEPGDRFRVFLRAGAELPGRARTSPAFRVERLDRPGSSRLLLELTVRARRAAATREVLIGCTHLPMWAPRRSALIIGDLSFRHHPEYYPPATRLRLEALVRWQAPRAGVVMTPSQFSREDLIETYRLDPDRVVVVPGAVEVCEPDNDDSVPVRQWARNLGITDRAFVLYLGNLHPRKNVARLIEAYARAGLGDVRLVIAGAPWWNGGGEERQAAAAEPNSVVLTGRVDDEQRSWLLRHAAALAYPSLFEGFGLPPLEAMAVGTPTLVSDAAVLPETCGDAALLVNARDVDQLAQGLRSVVFDGPLRRRLAKAGPERAGCFTAARTGAAARRALAVARDVG